MQLPAIVTIGLNGAMRNFLAPSSQILFDLVKLSAGNRHARTTRFVLVADVCFWPIASFGCAAELGRYGGIADIE